MIVPVKTLIDDINYFNKLLLISQKIPESYYKKINK